MNNSKNYGKSLSVTSQLISFFWIFIVAGLLYVVLFGIVMDDADIREMFVEPGIFTIVMYIGAGFTLILSSLALYYSIKLKDKVSIVGSLISMTMVLSIVGSILISSSTKKNKASNKQQKVIHGELDNSLKDETNLSTSVDKIVDDRIKDQHDWIY